MANLYKEERYYTFPLFILSLTNDNDQLFDYISAYFIGGYSVLTEGAYFDRSKFDNDDPQKILLIEESHKKRQKMLRQGRLRYYSEHNDVKYPFFEIESAQIVGRAFGYNEDRIKSYEPVYNFLRDEKIKIESTNNTEQPMVRIRWDVLQDYHKGDLSPNSFRVYCAILSSIGNKDYPVIIRKSVIRARATGLSAVKDFNQKERMGQIKVPILTDSKINTAREHLERRGLLKSHTSRNRNTFYAIKLSYEELADGVIQYNERQELKRTKRELEKAKQLDRLKRLGY